MRAVLAAICLWAAMALGALADDLSALARLRAEDSRIAAAEGGGLAIDLAISQPVPWRVRLLDQPPRLVLDVREVDWTGIETLALPAAVRAVRAGVFRAGWSRLVLELAGPQAVTLSEMATTGDTAAIRLRLAPASAQDFADAAARPEPPDWTLPDPTALPVLPEGSGAVVVVLDPGR
ncbi:MAG: AMIN domain-containing protein, partial [Fuscovulum sp.]|nr:AMIN domain-containing protein [Fuscovulum sp.]